MPDVVLIRPGCTDFEEQNRIQGSLDLPLNGRGQEQVSRVVQELKGVPLAIVYAPPCEPARSTALAVCEECGAAFKEVAEFRNVDYGLWQGLQIDDIRRKYPKVFKQWQESPETVCMPEGETLAEAVERVRGALPKRIKRKKSVAIVASEPLATLIACLLRGRPPERPFLLCSQHASPMVEIFRDVDPHLPQLEVPFCFHAAANGGSPRGGRGGSRPAEASGNGALPDGGKKTNGAQNGSHRTPAPPGVSE